MPDISPAPRPSDPKQTVVDCVQVVALRDIRVTDELDPGVMLRSTAVPTWERDPRCEGVSALGAVLLVRNPPIADIEKALVHALGVGLGWVLGFELGITGGRIDERQERRPDARLIGQGFVAGSELRARLHLRQLGHPPLKLNTTGPARGLIEQLLDTLTTSQLLEMAADSCRARAGKLPPDLAERLAEAETILRDLALVMCRPELGV
jgi:hypothetical protein